MIELKQPKPYLNGCVHRRKEGRPYLRRSHFGNNNEGNRSKTDSKRPAKYIGQLIKKKKESACITKVTIEILEVTIIPVFRP